MIPNKYRYLVLIRLTAVINYASAKNVITSRDLDIILGNPFFKPTVGNLRMDGCSNKKYQA